MSTITADKVLAVLAHHIGKGNAIHGDRLVAAVTGEPGPDPVGMRHLRKIITELRLDGHHICAHPTSGYFIAETDEELIATCEYLMERAMASLTQISRMRRVSLPDLRGQLKLPT